MPGVRRGGRADGDHPRAHGAPPPRGRLQPQVRRRVPGTKTRLMSLV